MKADAVTVRTVEAVEIDRLAVLWHEVWHLSHAPLVAEELTRLRTLESFRNRLEEAFSSIKVVGQLGAPVGFSIVRGDELYQLFVLPRCHGSGVAAALLQEAEAQLAAQGVRTAWLACAIGNERAARFYEKHGWRRSGTMVNRAETSAGHYALDVWRYEKMMSPSTGRQMDASVPSC